MSYTGSWSDALLYIREAVRLEAELYSANSVDYVHLANLMAYYYEQAGAYINAKEIYERNLAHVRETLVETDSISQVMSNTITTFYFTHGMWEEAEPFYLDALKVLEKSYGKLSQYYIMSLKSLGEFYIYAAWYQKAGKAFENLVELCKKFYGEESADYATSLNDLAVAYEKQLKLNQAEATYLKSLEIKKKVYTTQSEYYALTLTNLGVVYDLQNRPEDAEKVYNEALEIYKTINGESSHAYGMAVLNLAQNRFNNGNINDGLDLFKKALGILEKAIGSKSVDYSNALNNYADALSDAGKYKEAESTYAEVCRLKHNILGATHEYYGTALYSLATLKVTLGKYEEADALFQDALEVIIGSAGKYSESHGRVLNSRAIYFKETGQLKSAEKTFIKCLKVYDKVFGPLHPEYGTILNNLGQFYTDLGEYDKAEDYLNESLEIQTNAYGEDHPDISFILINLAQCYAAKSELANAETFMLRAHNLIESYYGKSHPDYASSARSLGYFYYETGNFSRSESYYLEALEIQEKIYGKEHKEYATTLNNIGALYLQKTYYARPEKVFEYNRLALQYFEDAFRIDSTMMGKDHPELAFNYNNIAEVYRQVGELDKAEPMYLKAIDIYRNNYGSAYDGIAISQSNLSLLYSSRGDLEKAEKYGLESIETYNDLFGPDNNAATTVTINLGYIYHQKGEIDKATRYYIKALDINGKYLEEFFSFMSEQEKLSYLKTASAYYEQFADFSAAVGNVKPELTAIVYNNELKYKGLIQRSASGLRRTVLASGDTTMLTLFEEWTDAKGRLSNLYSTPGSETSRINEVEDEANKLEKELISRSTDFKELLVLNDWQTVQAGLLEDEFAIEFLSYNDVHSGADTIKRQYTALLLSKQMKYPEMIKLFTQDELESIIGKVTGKTKVFVDSIYGSNQHGHSTISSIIWNNLYDKIDSGSTVYYAPSGLLHKISFSGLSIHDDYLSDRYNLRCLSNTGNIGNKLLIEDQPTISIFGGAKYSTEQSEQEIWKYLAGTETEAHNIGNLFENNGISVSENIGENASEDQFKSYDGFESPDILHIATHGFFYADPELVATETVVEEGDLEFRGAGIGVQTFVENPNPLMRSGLVFSRANDVWSKSNFDGEDGVLTAYEVSNMYLGNTTLAVMSACETGLGDIEGSEGVFGLQRAFKIAGVDYLIMSLWQVPDKETAEFMTLFYTNLISTHDIQGAFDYAQAEMRSKYAPYFWAAFVLTN